jgi:glycosidase
LVASRSHQTVLPLFQDGNSDGVGDLQGLTTRLGYIKNVLGA